MTLVEIDPELAGIAAENIARNGLEQRVRAVALDVDRAGGRICRPRHRRPASADRVLMNPPFNDPARQNVSPDPGRRAAHVAGDEPLGDWVDGSGAGCCIPPAR